MMHFLGASEVPSQEQSLDQSQFLDLWLKAGGTALGVALVQAPVTSTRGEIIFPSGLSREILFSRPFPQYASREFFVDGPDERVGKVTFAILMEEGKKV